jgi:hypothetical protein
MEKSSAAGDFSGMTVNERLFAAGLLLDFDEAAKHRDRERMINILRQVRVGTPEWSVDTILANPERYGY